MKKLSWEQICKEYNGEWVHLVDYEWEDSSPYPRSGVVNIHATTRKEFDQLMLQAMPISGARVYVGDSEEGHDLIMMGSLMRVTCA